MYTFERIQNIFFSHYNIDQPRHDYAFMLTAPVLSSRGIHYADLHFISSLINGSLDASCLIFYIPFGVTTRPKVILPLIHPPLLTLRA